MATATVRTRGRFARERKNRGTTLQPVKLDELDWRIIAELQADGRLSYNELARRVHLSGPAVAERVRRLEREDVITGYGARVSAERVGQPLTAFIEMRCSLGQCLLRTTTAADFPEIAEIHKLSGQHCVLLKVRAASLVQIEGLTERLGTHGELRTHIVLSTQYEGRPVEPPAPQRPVTAAEGWT